MSERRLNVLKFSLLFFVCRDINDISLECDMDFIHYHGTTKVK